MADVPPELAAEVQKLERYHSENPQGRYFVPLANAYRKMGELEQAEALLREGLRRHPDYLSAHIVLGRCLADRSAADEAVSEFRYVLSVDPQNLIALRSLGELATEGGRREEAARWYRELLAVDPMNEEARQALETLEAAASPIAPAESFEGGAGWWERPAAEPEEDAAALTDPLGWSRDADATIPDAPADEVLSWGSVSLEIDSGAAAEPPREEAPADFYGSVELGGMELAGADAGADSPAEGWGGGGGGGWDPLAGSTIDLDAPAYEPPADGDGGEVVTETIAELYARQGFYDRAADTYRELIRRRGGDPSLEPRLREMELRAEGRWPGEEPAAPAPEPAFQPPFDADLPLPGDVDLGGMVEPEPAGWYEAAPEPAVGEDVFAASFEEGFGEGVGEAASAPVEAFYYEEPSAPAEEEPVFAADASFFGGGEEPAPAAAPARSVREYLASLVAWQPGSGAAAAAPELPAEKPEYEEEMPWLSVPAEEPAQPEAPGIEGLLADDWSGREAPAAPGEEEEEAYPWELSPPPPAAEEPPAAPAGGTGSFSFEEFFMEVSDAPAAPAPAPAPAAAPEPRPAPAPTPAPAAAQPAAEPSSGESGEEEDLESFQAWLQSLKR